MFPQTRLLSYGAKELVCRILDSTTTVAWQGYVAGLETGRARLWFVSQPHTFPQINTRVHLEIVLPENPDLESQRCLSATARIKSVEACESGATMIECSFRKACFQELNQTARQLKHTARKVHLTVQKITPAPAIAKPASRSRRGTA